jgi:hypothetical protein
VQDLDREVLALLAEDLLLLLLEDLAGPVVGIDDVVPDLERDALGFNRLEVLQLLFGDFCDGALLLQWPAATPPPAR